MLFLNSVSKRFTFQGLCPLCPMTSRRKIPHVAVATNTLLLSRGVHLLKSVDRRPVHTVSLMATHMTEKSRTCKFETNGEGSTRLVWKQRPSKVFVIKKIRAPEVLCPFKRLVLYLCQEKKFLVTVESHVVEEFKEDSEFMSIYPQLKTWSIDDQDPGIGLGDIDFVVCLGGDGTLLYLSSLFQEYVPPIIPFHLGSLGFLMTHGFQNFKNDLDTMLCASDDSPASVTIRVRLTCEIQSSSKPSSDDDTATSPAGYAIVGPNTTVSRMAVLNEVVIDRGASPYLTGLELACNERHVADVQGDGLIIATPTGSTAYAAAAGAPMVEPGVPGITVVPICPHSLSFRPIIVGLQRKLEVRVPLTSRHSAWVSCDGRNRQQLQPGDGVKISSHLWPMACVNNVATTVDWFTSLGECLQWNVRVSQKPLEDQQM